MPIDLPKFPIIVCTYRCHNAKMTVKVKTRNGKIIEAAPLVQVFVGQTLDNLASWMRKFGETDILLLSTEDTQREGNPYD